MATKRSKELKNLTKDELTAKLRDSEAQLFDARMKRATGQLANTASIWGIRKDIARMKTFLTQLNSGKAATGQQKAAR